MGFFFNHDEDLKERDEEQVRQLDRGTVPDATVKDVGKAVKGAIYETGAMANAGIRAVTGSKAAEFREKRDALKAERVTQSMSPGGRAMAKGTLLPDDNGDSAFLRNPVGYVVFNGAKQVPMLAISAIPGAAIGRGVKAAASLAKYAAPATTGATAVMGGVLNTGDVLHSVFTEMDKMTKKDWSKVPAYLKLVSQGMNYEEASGRLKDDAVANAGALAFGLGTVLNTFGVSQQLAKAGAGVGVKEGFAKGLAKGFGKEAAQEFAEEGSGNLIAQNATKFTDDFDWKQALEAASSGGVVGGVIGGGVGGVTNIRSRTPKIQVVAPGAAPSAMQAAAVQGAPLPPPVAPKTSPTAPATNVGPPVVATGAHVPPPGASTKTKSFSKKKKTANAPPVTVSSVPDPAQSAALQGSLPPPVVQQAPEVVPPPGPQVSRDIIPSTPPIIRKRAQADIIPPPPAPVAPPVVQNVQQPPVAPVESNIPLPPVEQVPPGSSASRLPQVLPDLAAQSRYEAQVAREAAKPDMSARGTRYDLGQNAEEVNNPAQHQAWRRLMEKEAGQPNASPIAKQAVSLFGKRGHSLPTANKELLKELHAQWIDEKQAQPKAEVVEDTKAPVGQRGKLGVYDREVKSADDFLRVIARENAGGAKEQDTETQTRIAAVIDTLISAPERSDVAEAITNSPYTKALMGAAAKIQAGTVTPQDYEFFRAVEKDFTAQTQEELDAETTDIEESGRGSIGMGTTDVVDEASTLRESDNDQVGVSVKSKAKIGVQGEKVSTPKVPMASEVRGSSESKESILARYANAPKPKSKEEIAAAAPKAPKPEPVTQRVTPTVKTKTEVVKEVKEKKAAIQKLEKRKEAMALAGQDLLDLRRKQQAAARTGDAQLEELITTVNGYRAGIKKTFGQAALDKLNSDVEKLLANEKFPAMRSRDNIDPFQGSMISDRRGNLITVYHGGPVGIQTFRPNRDLNGVGIYFSKDKSLANEYARTHEKIKGGETTVYEAQLNIKNPLVIKGKTFWHRLFDKVTFKTRKQLSLERQEGFRKSGHLYPADVAELQAQGYDGIVNEIADEIVVFESSQIRLLSNAPVQSNGLGPLLKWREQNTPAMRGSINVMDALRRKREPAGVYIRGDDHHTATRTTTVRELFAELQEAGDFDQLFTSDMTREAGKMMLPRLLQLAGDVKVHFLRSDSAALQTPNFRAAGMYDSIQNVIVLDGANRRQGGWAAHVVIHEVAHAAFFHALRNDNRTANLLEYFRQGVQDMITPEQLKAMGVDYGLTNVDELVAETWSNPTFQKFLADIEIPDELARKIGLPHFKRHSVWAAFVELVRKAMGFKPGTNNALEFVLAATSKLSSERLTQDEQTYFENSMDELYDSIPDLPNTSDLAPIAQMQGTILQAAKEKSSNSFFRNLQLNLTTLHQLAQMADKYFPEGMAMKVSDLVGSIAVRRQELMTGGSDKVVTLSHEMSEKYKGPEFNKYVDLAHAATSAAVNVAVPLTHPDNIHIKKGFAHSNARAVHKELHGVWNSLPAELKELWVKEVNFFREAQDTLSLNVLNNVIELALSRKDAALADRIHEGFMTDADKALFRTNETMRMISEAKELKKIKGYYTPKMRRGEYVLSGKYIMPAQYEPNRLKGTDKYVFDTRKDAEAFQTELRKLGLAPRGSKVYSVDATTGAKHYTYTDPVTGVTNLGPDKLPKLYRFSRGDTGSKQVYEVDVQTQMMEMFDNKAKGIAAEEQYRADGKFEMKGLQLKEELAANSKVISTSQMIRLKKSIAARDKYQNMSKAEKELLIQAMNELSLSWMASTNVNNRAKPRRNVLGASREHSRNVAEYSATSASAIAQAEKQPELAKAITDLENYSTDNAGQSHSLTVPRSEILTQLRKAVDNQEYKKPSKWNDRINTLLRIAFLKFLASPAYVMINMTQPFMLSLPTIGGRHGVVKTSMALTKAYNDIGFLGIMGAGLRDTAKATRDLVTGITSESADYIGDLHKRLATAPDGKELTDMLDYLYNIGIINRDAGIEIAELITKPGVLSHVGRSLEHIARQTSVAAEVINRVSTAVAAFRLERATGASYEQAKAYTQKVVANTQGIYSYANAPALFKHPLMSIPLQFRKYSQLYYSLLGNMVHQTFKGATRAEKIEAGKQLGIMFMTHVAMAGALGLPTEPLKVAFGLMGFIGIPVPSWDEIERGAANYSMDMFGDNFGDALVHGLPRLAGIDVHTRVGANSMLLFGTPDEATEDEWNAWIAKTVIGAPGSVIADSFKAKAAAEDGDWFKAAGLMIPVKMISDSVKAAENYTVGKKNAKGKQTQEPSGLTSAAIKAFGFKPAWIARKEEATSSYYAESRSRDARREELIDNWKNASGAGRRAAQKEITKFNKTVPKDAKITGGVLARALKRDKNYSKHGIYPGRRNVDLLERFLGE